MQRDSNTTQDLLKRKRTLSIWHSRLHSSFPGSSGTLRTPVITVHTYCTTWQRLNSKSQPVWVHRHAAAGRRPYAYELSGWHICSCMLHGPPQSGEHRASSTALATAQDNRHTSYHRCTPAARSCTRPWCDPAATMSSDIAMTSTLCASQSQTIQLASVGFQDVCATRQLPGHNAQSHNDAFREKAFRNHH